MGDTAPRSHTISFLAVVGTVALCLSFGLALRFGVKEIYAVGFEDGKESLDKGLGDTISISNASIFLAQHHGEMEKDADRIVICESPKSPISDFSYAQPRDQYGRDPATCNTLAGERTIIFPVTYDAVGTAIIGNPVLKDY